MCVIWHLCSIMTFVPFWLCHSKKAWFICHSTCSATRMTCSICVLFFTWTLCNMSNKHGNSLVRIIETHMSVKCQYWCVLLPSGVIGICIDWQFLSTNSSPTKAQIHKTNVDERQCFYQSTFCHYSFIRGKICYFSCLWYEHHAVWNPFSPDFLLNSLEAA